MPHPKKLPVLLPASAETRTGLPLETADSRMIPLKSSPSAVLKKDPAGQRASKPTQRLEPNIPRFYHQVAPEHRICGSSWGPQLQFYRGRQLDPPRMTGGGSGLHLYIEHSGIIVMWAHFPSVDFPLCATFCSRCEISFCPYQNVLKSNFTPRPQGPGGISYVVGESFVE